MGIQADLNGRYKFIEQQRRASTSEAVCIHNLLPLYYTFLSYYFLVEGGGRIRMFGEFFKSCMIWFQ